jgi:hypothetical protein
LQEVPELSPEEKELLLFLLDQHGSLEHYVVSSGLQAAEQRSLAAPLPAALPVLKDAYLAFAGALKSLQPDVVTETERNTSIVHASSAMVVLRSLPVANSQDAALCLTLGTVLASFVYLTVGAGVSDICHFCLNVTNPYMETSSPDEGTNTKQIFLVLLETMDCIVYRRKPTLRIEVRTPENVDQHLGISLPLLPYYYDLCAISHSLVNTPDTEALITHLHKRLDGIRADIQAWQPFDLENFADKFDSPDVVSLLAQAKVYRLAGLLVAHRLRYVFGQQDDQADTLSKEILMELELAHRITKQTPRFVTLPFLVAAVELRDTSARVKALDDVDKYVDRFIPVVKNPGRAFLGRVWYERDCNITTCWFDSVHKPCPVLNAIDAPCCS